MDRKCCRCGFIKDISLFATDRSKKHGKKYICKVCISIRDKKITVLESQDIHEEKTECSICYATGKALCNDHDHDTGFYRGKLCAVCNKALGSFKDSTVLLQRAIDYLDRHFQLVQKQDPTNE